jgi:protein-S-isoprenylcysteine O-methyltransferase Ste14
MNPWLAKAVIALAGVLMAVIRAPHGQRSRAVKVVKSRKGSLEVCVLGFAWLGFFIPLIWVTTPVFSFAEYPLHPIPWMAGTLCIALGLWLFYRSHADLGSNWSATLEVREHHRLISQGIYRHVRHPMYLAFLLYSLGQVLVLPNWVAGPSFLIAFGLLFGLRVGPEERMMLEKFGKEYEAYAARTKRLVPGVW